MTEGATIKIRRAPRDWQIGEVAWDDIEGLHWDYVSGGVGVPSFRAFVTCYVWCDKVRGEIAHSCRHGVGPHHIKVAIVKKDQEKAAWAKVLAVVGPRP